MKYYFKVLYKLESIFRSIYQYILFQKILFFLYGQNWFNVKLGRNFVCLGKHRINIGKKLEIGDNTRIQAEKIKFGNNVYIGHNNYIFGNVNIGNDFMSGPNVSIMGGNHGFNDTNISMIVQKTYLKGINIGNDVWIGANSVIVDGVNIASHCVIGGGVCGYKRYTRMGYLCR